MTNHSGGGCECSAAYSIGGECTCGLDIWREASESRKCDCGRIWYTDEDASDLFLKPQRPIWKRKSISKRTVLKLINERIRWITDMSSLEREDPLVVLNELKKQVLYSNYE